VSCVDLRRRSRLEVGALTERAAEKEGPALLFSKFKGFPGGFRVISNVFRTCSAPVRRWESRPT
jgi:3-polyprenyl-4-hydroxybenzoate decarboxylase